MDERDPAGKDRRKYGRQAERLRALIASKKAEVEKPHAAIRQLTAARDAATQRKLALEKQIAESKARSDALKAQLAAKQQPASVQMGERGGRFHLSPNGTKVYEK